MSGPVQLAHLPDNILLRIFSFALEEVWTPRTSHEDPTLNAQSLDMVESSRHSQKKNKKPKKGDRIAGPGARMLCRLCCCSHRFNHLASADQLWQPLTLIRFPDRHWPTDDEKNLELIRVRREHQPELSQASVSSDLTDSKKQELTWTAAAKHKDDPTQERNGDCQKLDDDGHQSHSEDGQNKKQKRTKFYSRRMQREYRRQLRGFSLLDPELKYTPLAWTNTMWSWKRTYFGNCRAEESREVKTPNRIELDQALNDPNCTPMLLYPSHSAVDIQTFVPKAALSTHSGGNNTGLEERSRYYCQDCVHFQQDDALSNVTLETGSKDSTDAAMPSPVSQPYPYKLIIALDGSWSHAKIMYRYNPRLQQLAQIKFLSPPQSIYHELKPEPKTTYTSTAEAVGQAVALLGWPSFSSDANGLPTDEKSLTDAELLLEDLIRPLKKMIEIQDTIAEDQSRQD
ncbi:hypothetical protein BGZ58_009235 [Dissophora ornata]|nr:hypothetical protein BGZ58_009235 [Dissophora ornata]